MCGRWHDHLAAERTTRAATGQRAHRLGARGIGRCMGHGQLHVGVLVAIYPQKLLPVAKSPRTLKRQMRCRVCGLGAQRHGQGQIGGIAPHADIKLFQQCGIQRQLLHDGVRQVGAIGQLHLQPAGKRWRWGIGSGTRCCACFGGDFASGCQRGAFTVGQRLQQLQTCATCQAYA